MAHFTILGRRYELAAADTFSFEETLLYQRLSGRHLTSIETDLTQVDAGAYLALFLISIRRAEPQFPEQDLRAQKLFEVLATLEPDEADPGPPARGVDGPAGSDGSTPPRPNGSETSGSPASPTGSLSSPPGT